MNKNQRDKKFDEIHTFIQSVRDLDDDWHKLFTQGGCFEFYKMLKEKFPDATAWYFSGHIYTEISGALWDIDGFCAYKFKEVEPNRYEKANEWNPFLTEIDNIKNKLKKVDKVLYNTNI